MTAERLDYYTSIQYHGRMKVRIQKLRYQGQRLPPQDWQNTPPLVGNLSLHQVHFKGFGSVEVLELWEISNQTQDGKLAVLYEPRLVSLGNELMLFRGVETIGKAGVVQEWRVELASP